MKPRLKRLWPAALVLIALITIGATQAVYNIVATTCSASNWVRVISITGAATCSQPTSSDVSGLTTNATAAVGQLPGTTTNDNAAAGKVGEYISASNEETGLQGATTTVTITIASPAVVTWGTTTPFGCNGAGGAAVNFTTSGALPTGLTAGVTYYVICASISGNTFQVATSIDNAIAGTAINTSGTQSGTQTGNPVASLASGSAIDIAGFQLTAGDWDVTVDLGFAFDTTTSITALAISHNTTATTQSAIPGRRARIATAAEVPNGNNILHAGPGRYSLSGNQTIYCSAAATFSLSFANAWGGCHARRVR